MSTKQLKTNACSKPRENQNNKKTELVGEVLVSGPKLFFGVPREMSFFGFRFFKTKKLDVFLEWILALSKAKNKNNVVFVFCMDCFYISSKNLSKNQKKTWVVFALLQVRIPSKKQRLKTCLMNLNQKNRGKATKTTLDLKPKLLQQVVFFVFLAFSRFRKTHQNLWSHKVQSVFDIGAANIFPFVPIADALHFYFWKEWAVNIHIYLQRGYVRKGRVVLEEMILLNRVGVFKKD